MPLDIENVHVLQRKKGTNELAKVRTNLYSRMVREGETPVLVQGGKFYSDGGGSIPTQDVPMWAIKQLGRMSPEGRENIGLKDGWEDVKDAPGKTPKPEVKVQELKKEEVPISIVDAVYSLDATNDDNWTKDGKPQTKAIMDLVGRYVSRGELEELTGEYRPLSKISYGGSRTSRREAFTGCSLADSGT